MEGPSAARDRPHDPDLTMGEECQMTDLDTTVGEGARSLDLLAA
jgi:hypothetical protein